MILRQDSEVGKFIFSCCGVWLTLLTVSSLCVVATSHVEEVLCASEWRLRSKIRGRHGFESLPEPQTTYSSWRYHVQGVPYLIRNMMMFLLARSLGQDSQKTLFFCQYVLYDFYCRRDFCGCSHVKQSCIFSHCLCFISFCSSATVFEVYVGIILQISLGNPIIYLTP